jgi:hypothetical protein
VATGRGGSTWIMEQFKVGNYLCLFEPFQDLILKGSYDKPIFIDNEEEIEDVRNLVRKRITGKSLTLRSFIGVSLWDVFRHKSVVFKTVNLHFLLNLFLDDEVISRSIHKTMVLVRDPYFVLKSESKLLGRNYNERHYIDSLRLSEFHPLNVYNDYINDLETNDFKIR